MMSSADIAQRLAELREQHDSAANEADRARENAARLRGLGILDRATPDEIEAAESAAEKAEARAADLGAALDILDGEHAAALAVERDRRHAQLVKKADGQTKEREAARRALKQALNGAQAALRTFDSSNATLADLAAELGDVDGLPEAERALKARYDAYYESEVKVVPDRAERLAMLSRMEVAYDNERDALRADAARRAAEVAPPLDDAALREVSDPYAGEIARLLATPLRVALGEGAEFVSRPVAAGGTSSSFRAYGHGELEEARRRHGAFLAALDKLSDPASPIGHSARTATVVHQI